MFWLRRPPYLRWIAAAVVLIVGITLDLRSGPVVAYPFTAEPIRQGELIDSVSWREVPSGLLPASVDPFGQIALTDIPASSPILPSLATPDGAAPAGWWVISLPVPGLVAPGTAVRVAGDGVAVEGVVAGAAVNNGFELTAPVAFPPELADLVAGMATNSALVVMTGS